MGFFLSESVGRWARMIRNGPWAHFLFLGFMHKAPPELTKLVRGAVEALGYELVGVELLSRPHSGHLLRIYIDGEGGVNLTDCEKTSHQVSGVLEVEDPIRGDYSLEVSSPGLDRPLFEKAHFERFAGHVVRVKLNVQLEGRSNYKGTIVAVDGDDVVVQVDGEPVRLPFARLSSARLVPQF
jgi:ribosome maturation factor RimP